MIRGDGDAPAATAPRPADAADGARPAAFLPPDLAIQRSGEDPPQGLTVHVAGDWAPGEVIGAWTSTKGRFERYLAERQVVAPLPAPITVVVVPQRTLCDVRIFEGGEVPDKCGAMAYYYRPGEQTLLVADDRARLGPNLGGAMGFIACLHVGGKVCDLIDGFEKHLAEPVEGGNAAHDRKPG